MNLHARELGKLGGKKSVEIRFEGMNKEQKSELMRKVRLAKKEPLVKYLKDCEQI